MKTANLEQIEAEIKHLQNRSKQIRNVLREIILLVFLILTAITFCNYYGDCKVREHPFLYLLLTLSFFIGIWGYVDVQIKTSKLE